jgi:hypothetical protein
VAIHLDSPERAKTPPSLDSDFSARLEGALHVADSERRRRALKARLASLASVLLLIGPLAAWKLIGATPGGEHVVVDSMVWLTFALDAAVHVDNATLGYLHLQAIPVVVGALLLLLVGAVLLWKDPDE